MQPGSDAAKEHTEVAEKIRSGEYFREARAMYDLTVHDPMAERYFYVLVSVLAGIIFLVSIVAVNGLYPLKRSVPFIVSTSNITEEYPNIHTLMAGKDDTPSAALLRFIVQNYVVLRETYDINIVDRNTNGVQSQSSPEVFAEYQHLTDPTNPESPIALYQRHSKRTVQVLSMRQLGDNSMEAVLESSVIGKNEVKKSTWQVNIAFNYSGVALDESTGKVKPFTFSVTSYKVKRLQDAR